MKSKLSSRIWLVACSSLALALIVGSATVVGIYFGNRLVENHSLYQLPAIELNAATGARTQSMSMATGLVDDAVEGLFVLDHLSGNLQCWLLNQRTGTVGGIYTVNVAADLTEGGKTAEPEYMMVTGNFLWTGGNRGNEVPGRSICYVGDAATGNVVGYGLMYSPQAIRRGTVQNGTLNLVCKGTVRGEAVTRDQ